MGELAPFEAVWSAADGAFKPLGRYHNIVGAHVGDGEIVQLASWEDRSEKSHRHQFAWLRNAWQNLPESIAEEFANPTALRKWALIKCGYFEEQRIDVGTHAGAVRVAQAIRAMPAETYSAIVVRGHIVAVRRAESQSQRAMGHKRFQESKTAILEAIADLMGVEPHQLERAQAA